MFAIAKRATGIKHVGDGLQRILQGSHGSVRSIRMVNCGRRLESPLTAVKGLQHRGHTSTVDAHP
jgi:hypothetical protein